MLNAVKHPNPSGAVACVGGPEAGAALRSAPMHDGAVPESGPFASLRATARANGGGVAVVLNGVKHPDPSGAVACVGGPEAAAALRFAPGEPESGPFASLRATARANGGGVAVVLNAVKHPDPSGAVACVGGPEVGAALRFAPGGDGAVPGSGPFASLRATARANGGGAVTVVLNAVQHPDPSGAVACVGGPEAGATARFAPGDDGAAPESGPFASLRATARANGSCEGRRAHPRTVSASPGNDVTPSITSPRLGHGTARCTGGSAPVCGFGSIPSVASPS